MQAPRLWRTQKTRYRLLGSTCSSCEKATFPPRDVCRHCGSTELIDRELTGRGEVYTYSMVYQAPEGFTGAVPYATALVQLEEGPLVATQLTDIDPEQLRIGLPVEMVTRRVAEDGANGVVVYGYKFRPRLGEPDSGSVR